MTILNDRHIDAIPNLIDPYWPQKVSEEGKLSFGLEPYGYTVRLSDEFLVLPTTRLARYYGIELDWYNEIPWQLAESLGCLDVKETDKRYFERVKNYHVTIPPNSIVLGRSIETITLPNNVTAIVEGKSSYARVGILVNVTPLDAGWSGQITMCIANLTQFPNVVYANEGIAQVLFFRGEKPMSGYIGKYQNSKGVVI